MQSQLYNQANSPDPSGNPQNPPDSQDTSMDNTDSLETQDQGSPEPTRIMPGANPSGVLTINKSQPQAPQAVPQSSGMIDSFIKKDKSTDTTSEALSVSFTVLPEGNELKGIALMEAVIKACESCQADIISLTIKKDEKK